jgi:Fic family protein
VHIEVQKHGRKKFYYLAHSYREGARVRKVRQYLGFDLSDGDIDRLRLDAEKVLLERLSVCKRIGDPLHTVLSPAEKESVNALIAGYDDMVWHLSEEDWLAFTEAFAYDTNAIEGSTVTVSEVRDIIEADKWPKNRSKGDIAETYGVAEAIEYIRKTREHMSLDLIRELHKTVFKNSKDYAGSFRGKGIEVVVADGRGNIMHRGAPQKQITALLKELIAWYDKNRKKYHPIVLAAVVHNQFENIHPFQDGNGRVGRLLLNNILLKNRLPPVNIRLKDRQEYYSVLQAYEKEGNIRPTIEFILKSYKNPKKTV